MKVYRLSLLLVCLAFSRIHAKGVGDDYLVNGGFETGDFTGWSGAGQVTSSAAAIGNYGLLIDLAGFGTFGQDVPTETGARYQLSLRVKSDHASPFSFSVLWDGFGVGIGPAQLSSTYSLFSFDLGFSSHGAIGTGLQFLFNQSAGDFMIDDVHVVMTSRPVATPESGATLLLLSLGVLALLSARRFMRVGGSLR